MTDARLPDRWLADRRLLRLPDDAFRLFVNALLWSVANRTDGLVYDDDLSLIPCARPAAASRLLEAGLWDRAEGYWLITDFADTQSSRDELDALAKRRLADRQRKAAERLRKASSPDVSQELSRDASRDSHAERVRTGQARLGQAPTGTDDEPDSAGDSWPEVARCSVCGGPLDPVLAEAGFGTHPTCDPGEGA